MIKKEILEVPIVTPQIKIDKATRLKLRNLVKEESQVIVHCYFEGRWDFDRIRIWKSTFLYAKGSSHRSKMILHENIALYPAWTAIGSGQSLIFTLIFTGLPKSCKEFDLIEDIPEPGGFIYKNIPRNNSDVYHIKIV